jgi:hypothetical protein
MRRVVLGSFLVRFRLWRCASILACVLLFFVPIDILGASPAEASYHLDVHSLQVEGKAVALHPIRISARVRNEGPRSTEAAFACLYAARPGDNRSIVGEIPLTLLAGEETRVSYTWAPPMDGQWEMWLVVGDRGLVHPFDEDRVIVDVLEAPQPTLRWTLQPVGTAKSGWAIVGMLVGLAAMTAALFLLALHSLEREKVK